MLWRIAIFSVFVTNAFGAHCFCKVTADGQEIQKFTEGGYNQLFEQGKCRSHCEGIWDGASTESLVAWAQANKICDRQVTMKMEAAVGTASYQVVRQAPIQVPPCVPLDGDGPWFQYAAKFVCGQPPASPNGLLKAGDYFTTVNVHNPSSEEKTIRKQFSFGAPDERMGPLSDGFTADIGGSRTIDIQCSDILRLSNNPSGITGFAVIESPAELDVVSVYSAGPVKGEVATLHAERVPARRLETPTIQPCTGVDLSTGKVIWQVTKPGGATSPAVNISPNSVYSALSGASWIAPTQDVQPGGDYDYRACFCGCSKPSLELQGLADNSLQVFLNTPVNPVYSYNGPAGGPGDTGFSGNPPVVTVAPIPSGLNCIIARVHNNPSSNSDSTVTGLALRALVTNARPTDPNGKCGPR